MKTDNSSQASKCNDGNCWVEAGYLADNNAGNCVQAYALCYFWADNRPGGGFHEHNRLLPSDDVGTNTQFIIERDQYNSSYWYVSIYTANNGDGDFFGTSTNNLIYPQDIQIGMELAGSSGAHAPFAYFSQNGWESSGHYGSFNWQGNSGSWFQKNPPVNSGWDYPPNGSNQGGIWDTQCNC